jgi:transposase
MYLRIRDALNTIDEDSLFADLFSHTGQPAEALWYLALICIMQYVAKQLDVSIQYWKREIPQSACEAN